MNSRLVFSVLACCALAQAQSDQPVINTPQSVVQCLPSLITFSGGAPPHTITVIPGGQPGAAPLVDLGTQSSSSLTWKANLASGTSITFQIRDSRGVINYSQAVTIQPSSDSSCLGSSSSSGDQSSSPSPTSPSAPVSTGSSVSSPSAGTNSSSVVPATNTTANSTSTSPSPARANSTTPLTPAAPITNSTVSNPAATNQSRSPSVFTPTSNTSASTNAQNSAAPGTPVQSKDLLAGLAITGVVLSIFA